MAEQVTVTKVKHPRYAYRVNFPDGSKRLQKWFKTKTGKNGADEWAAAKRKELRDEGAKSESINDDERRAVMAFREMVMSLPKAVTRPSLADAVKLMSDTLGVRHKSKSITDLVDSYLLALKRKEVSQAHLYSVKIRLDRFEESYGDWLACDVSREVVTEWLADLKFASLTVNHYRAALTQLFNHGLAESMIEKNPVAGIAKKKVKSKEVGILKPREVAALLENAPTEILAGLAIGFFAGVRRAELCRMDWSEIDFDHGHIEIKASKSKTASRRLIPMSENLRAWLLPIRQQTGGFMPSEMIWRTRLADAMSAAKIATWPHNAPRHSFASYHLGKNQDAAALALEMGHTTTKTIFEHYRALVTPAAAESYWSIMPADSETIIDIKSA